MKLRVIKKGNIVVPLFILFFGISYADLVIKDIVFPLRFNLLNQNLKKESIQFYYNTDIGIVDKENLIDITYDNFGAKINYIFKSMLLTLDINKENSNFRYGENLYLFNYKKSDQKLATNIKFNYRDYFAPSLLLEIDDNNNFSYGISFSSIIKSKFNLVLNHKVSPSNYLLELSYNDFLFSHLITQINKTQGLAVSFNDKSFDISFISNNSKYNIDKTLSDNIEQDIALNFREDKYSAVKINFKIDNINHIKLNYYNKNMSMALNITNTIIKPNGIEEVAELIRINHLSYNSNFKSISYSRLKEYTNIEIGWFKKYIFLFDSSALRPRSIDDSFELLWSCIGLCTIVNNTVNGIIKTDGIFINFKKIVNEKNEYMVNSIYVNDYYDIYSKNTLQPLGPQSTSIFTFNDKEAIILGIGISHKFKKNTLGFMFNQHIPININKIDSYDENSNSNNSNGQSQVESENKKYGGSSIKILFSINI